MQQQERRLRRNRQGDLVAYEQAAGSLEVLFLDEHARVAEQFALVCLTQTREDGHASLDHAAPVIGKRLGAQSLAAARLTKEGHSAS